MIQTIIAWVLLILPVLPLAVVVMLIEHTWSNNIALRERTGLAIRDLLVASVVSVASADYLFDLNLPDPLLWSLFVMAFIAMSAPSAIWLAVYFRGGFE